MRKKKDTNILKTIGEWHGYILIVGLEKKITTLKHEPQYVYTI